MPPPYSGEILFASLVALILAGIAAAALHADDVLVVQDGGGVDALPAHAGALIQGIGGAGGAAGLHDDLGALAEIHHAVGTLAHEQAAVHGQTILAALAGIDDVVVRQGDGAAQRQLAGGVGRDLRALAAAQHIAAHQCPGGHGAAVKADGSGAVGGGAGGQRAAAAGQIVAAEDLGLGGLHEAHAVQLTDLAGEQLCGGGVLMGGHPVGVVQAGY